MPAMAAPDTSTSAAVRTVRLMDMWSTLLIMTYGVYSPGRAVAQRLQDHFARHLRDAAAQPMLPGQLSTGPLPPVDAIDALIDAAFWTSLRREEGYIPKISLALLPPAAAQQPLMFERPLPLA